jgi:uncharacterized protein (TIGR03067 family)
MRRVLSVLLVVGLVGAASFPPLPWSDRGRLQGNWVVVSAKEGGSPTEELNGAIYTFDGDALSIHSPHFEMSGQPYRLNDARDFKEIDIILGGPRPGARRQDADRLPPPKVIRGIYQIQGDTLTLCTATWKPVQDANGTTVVEPGARPSAFDSRFGTLVILKRQTKGH